MQTLRSIVDRTRDRWAPVSHTSTFRATGQITPEEFVLAGDYLVYKFPSWSWAPATSKAQQVAYLPADKQYLMTRGVPCRRRLDENFAGDAGKAETMVGGEDGDEEWLNTGGPQFKAHERDVKTLTGSQPDVEQDGDDEDEIPDMDDEDDDEAIIRDSTAGTSAPMRTYSLYITYTPYYSTPRMYLSGYSSPGVPLPPTQMLEDIVGDYKDKTVTLEDFPFFETSVKMASIHPCRHASVMKTLLDRADAAMKIRKMKDRREQAQASQGLDSLTEGAKRISLGEREGSTNSGNADEWEVLEQEGDDSEAAIRVDQYIVVFLKFMASVTPGIEHDQTMGV